MIARIRALLSSRNTPGEPQRLEGENYVLAPRIERLAFVCGLHRSGTTLIERVLVDRFEVACLRADVPESEGQHMQSVYAPARNFGGPGRFAFSQKIVDEAERIGTGPDVQDALLADWSRFVVGDAPVLVEKSPPNLVRIAWLRAVFPGSCFVIVVRDPRAVAAATQKWSGSSLPEMMMHWNAAHSRALDDFDPADCVVVRYEDFCADAETELARIAGLAALTPRTETSGVEHRFQAFRNSNADYITAHEGQIYGRAVWRELGYDC